MCTHARWDFRNGYFTNFCTEWNTALAKIDYLREFLNNFMKFHAFLCRFQVWNCIDRCNVSHVYAILKCETLSFDVIWKNIILLWVHALFRDPLRGGRGNFTEIKFNQIRGRLGTFGDFFAKILRFEGFSRFSLSCRRRYSSAVHLIGRVVSSYVGSFRLWFAPFSLCGRGFRFWILRVSGKRGAFFSFLPLPFYVSKIGTKKWLYPVLWFFFRWAPKMITFLYLLW